MGLANISKGICEIYMVKYLLRCRIQSHNRQIKANIVPRSERDEQGSRARSIEPKTNINSITSVNRALTVALLLRPTLSFSGLLMEGMRKEMIEVSQFVVVNAKILSPTNKSI